MSGELRFEAVWQPPFDDVPEVAATSAAISIKAGGRCITRNENTLSLSVIDDALLSAYPLALWFARSWWRLRWEVPLEGPGQRRFGRRMAHELPSAGGGFVWPSVSFESDGDTVLVKARRTTDEPRESVIYLLDYDTAIPAPAFERAVDSFVTLTLARLYDRGLRETELHGIWSTLCEERKNPEIADDRQLEARLGYDVGDLPDQIRRTLLLLSRLAGSEATKDVASGCAAVDPAAALESMVGIEDAATAHGRLRPLHGAMALRALWQGGTPWGMGWELARAARTDLALGLDPIEEPTICDALGIAGGKLPDPVARGTGQAFGLCVRDPHLGALAFYPRKPHRTGKRFEYARFVCDSITAGQGDRWLPATDAGTSRQKVQRAFAAEWLCPLAGVLDLIGDDRSPEAVEAAATRYDVSYTTVTSLLVNSGHAQREEFFA